jgi:RNA polymerase sigma-70 factor (ECF subfamily)
VPSQGRSTGGAQPAPGIDDAVIAAARVGDAAAVERIYRALQPLVLRFLRGVEPRHADDLAGEVWIAVARGLADFDGPPEAFRAWVFSIARRRLADLRRTAARRRTDPVEPSTMSGRVATGATPEEALEASEGQAAVDRIVALLPAEHAEVVLLRVLADLDAESVARIMGRSAGWVRVTQHRALARLAEALREESSPDV